MDLCLICNAQAWARHSPQGITPGLLHIPPIVVMDDFGVDLDNPYAIALCNSSQLQKAVDRRRSRLVTTNHQRQNLTYTPTRDRLCSGEGSMDDGEGRCSG